MQKEDIIKAAENFNKLYTPMNYHLDLIEAGENKTKVKLSFPKMKDVFKVQGKIVDTSAEIKKTLEKTLKANFSGVELEIEFVEL